MLFIGQKKEDQVVIHVMKASEEIIHSQNQKQEQLEIYWYLIKMKLNLYITSMHTATCIYGHIMVCHLIILKKKIQMFCKYSMKYGTSLHFQKDQLKEMLGKLYNILLLESNQTGFWGH